MKIEKFAMNPRGVMFTAVVIECSIPMIGPHSDWPLYILQPPDWSMLKLDSTLTDSLPFQSQEFE